MKKGADNGLYFSIPPIITKLPQFQISTEVVSLSQLLTETDAPYLAPVPFRGKTNQPGYTRYVVEEIARLKGLSFETVAEATTANFNRLFKL